MEQPFHSPSFGSWYWCKTSFRAHGLPSSLLFSKACLPRSMGKVFLIIKTRSLHHLRRPQASFRSPEGEETLRPPLSDLRSPGIISKHGGFRAPDGWTPFLNFYLISINLNKKNHMHLVATVLDTTVLDTQTRLLVPSLCT